MDIVTEFEPKYNVVVSLWLKQQMRRSLNSDRNISSTPWLGVYICIMYYGLQIQCVVNEYGKF